MWEKQVDASLGRLRMPQKLKLYSLLGLDPGTGKRLARYRLGYSVSLWWVTTDLGDTRGYGDLACEVDLSVLDYYWWDEDQVAGEGSYFFVLPTSCPQAPPSVLKSVTRIWEPERPTRLW
jgi:hypothetical protein